ncbi:hypothetical protein D1641_08590 [Colidextribacter sp. OB.20]|uniref:hypothetical protein n=1 Tax=Colidextribacter sp. OB.20 TaxID=2304568 RepID=UPI0013716C3A|nr:hypothetical protein [Colidextribacter sp. OB.20]NBI10076.1 hypothetical protein [Colidextribacter sp. OB.20]
MKKLDKRWTIRLGALGLSAALLGTVAALAAGGGQADPLVTLSYLNETALPQLVEQVEEKASQRQEELEQSFARQIELYKRETGQTGSSGTGASAGYTLVTMSSGQTMSLQVGCEVLLRVGAASVQADGNPALIDLTSGGTINAGASLTKNHLYMSTIEGRTLTASGTVKLLVRGGYSVA